MDAAFKALTNQSEHISTKLKQIMHLNNIKLLRIKQVIELTTLPKSTIYQRMKEGKFPRPLNLGGRDRAWRIEDILQWRENPSAYICAY